MRPGSAERLEKRIRSKGTRRPRPARASHPHPPSARPVHSRPTVILSRRDYPSASCASRDPPRQFCYHVRAQNSLTPSDGAHATRLSSQPLSSVRPAPTAQTPPTLPEPVILPVASDVCTRNGTDAIQPSPLASQCEPPQVPPAQYGLLRSTRSGHAGRRRDERAGPSGDCHGRVSGSLLSGVGWEARRGWENQLEERGRLGGGEVLDLPSWRQWLAEGVLWLSGYGGSGSAQRIRRESGIVSTALHRMSA